MGRSRAPRPLPCGAPESLARVQLGRGSDARRAAVAARHPDRTPLQPSETPDGRRSCAWTAPLFRPLLQQVGPGTVFRKAGCKDPSGSEACEGRSTRLHAPGVGQSEGTSPHRSEGPPHLSLRPIAGDIAPTVRAVVDLHDATAPSTRSQLEGREGDPKGHRLSLGRDSSCGRSSRATFRARTRGRFPDGHETLILPPATV
jgi:hypothetical protein